MRLVYLPTNLAYVFTYGDSIIQMGDYSRFFSTRADAVAAAESCGLAVSRRGVVSSI